MRLDGPDAAHQAKAVRADGGTSRRLGFVVGLLVLLDLEQVSHLCELFGALVLDQETVVTNAMEVVR